MTAPVADPLARMTLNQLRSFMAISELRSFRAAAARVHVSQSALSVQVQRLEEALGIVLFDRTTRSVSLTGAGDRLLATARRMAADLSQVVLELHDEALLQRGVVTVAVLPSLAASVVPGAMRAFAAIHPGIEVRLRDADSRRAVELVRAGEVDLGLLSRHASLETLRFTPLFRDEFVALVPASGHPLSSRKRVEIAELGRHALLLNPRGVDLREALETLFRAVGVTPVPAQELTSTHGLVTLVGAGFGASVLPRLSLTGLDLGACRVLQLRQSAGREIGVLQLANRSDSPAMAAFRSFLVDWASTRSGEAGRSPQGSMR
jgi:LysR family carnitine catabolism transcriptional activator